MTETITSTQNPKLKQLRKLQDKKERQRSGLFAAEGEDLLSTAVALGRQPVAVYYNDELRDRVVAHLAGLDPDVEIHPVRGEVLDSASVLGSGTRLIGVWEQPQAELDAASADGPLVYLHDVGDPGNVGTVLRSASAFGAAAVVLSPEAADPFSPKAVRAGMGAQFSTAIVRATFEQLQGAAGERRSVALVPRSGRPLAELGLGPADLIVLGSERAGLPDRISRSCAEIAQIELDEAGSESLNVAMTATLCLYETTLRRLPRRGSREESQTS